MGLAKYLVRFVFIRPTALGWSNEWDGNKDFQLDSLHKFLQIQARDRRPNHYPRRRYDWEKNQPQNMRCKWAKNEAEEEQTNKTFNTRANVTFRDNRLLEISRRCRDPTYAQDVSKGTHEARREWRYLLHNINLRKNRQTFHFLYKDTGNSRKINRGSQNEDKLRSPNQFQRSTLLLGTFIPHRFPIKNDTKANRRPPMSFTIYLLLHWRLYYEHEHYSFWRRCHTKQTQSTQTINTFTKKDGQHTLPGE